MKALLMAAGVGSRISRHLGGKPKCCISINDTILIKHTFELLNSLGITDIAIITGYAETFILDALKDFKFTHYKNPFFDVTNSIASAWFARDFLDDSDDIIMMNADVFIEKNGLENLLEDTRSPLFLADSTRIEDADYKFAWTDDKLTAYGKELTPKETNGEYVGIAKINKEDIFFFKKELENFINNQKHDFWWEDIFYRNIEKKDVHVKDISGTFWAEVDYIEDYERIKTYLGEKNG